MISQFRRTTTMKEEGENIETNKSIKESILSFIIAMIKSIIIKIQNKLKIQHPTTIDLIRTKGHNAEEHEVMTKDGYIITMHRIPPLPNKRNGKSVFFMHGAMLTSEIFVCKEKDNLAINLSLQGYDVWLGNRRGNRYAKKHYLLSEDEDEFWNFSMDETIEFDIPCQIEYIKSDHLTLIGFSQGSAEIFAFLSSNGKNVQNIRSFVALSATAKPKSICKWLYRCPKRVLYFIFGRSSFLSQIVPLSQKILSPTMMVTLIDGAIEYLFNWKMNQIDRREKDNLYKHLYSTTSVKQIIHWFQIIREQRFWTFSGGEEYHINKIRIPILLVWGTKDSLIDVKFLKDRIPHSILLPIEGYEHLDPLWAQEAKEKVNEKVEGFIGNH